MDIHEYQAKEILARFGVPVPRGGLAYSPEQAGYRARELGGSAWVVKAQIHSGGRGAAGGVKLCRSADEVQAFAGTLFGKQLVTKQTDAKGKRTTIKKQVHRVQILDPATGTGTFLAEAIKQIAAKVQGMQVGQVAFGLSKEGRAKVEGEAQTQAIEQFKARASDLAKGFGFSSYSLREVSVNSNEMVPGPRPRMMAAEAKMSMSSDSAVPVEAGKAQVIVNVSGSVQMR